MAMIARMNKPIMDIRIPFRNHCPKSSAPVFIPEKLWKEVGSEGAIPSKSKSHSKVFSIHFLNGDLCAKLPSVFMRFSLWFFKSELWLHSTGGTIPPSFGQSNAFLKKIRLKSDSVNNPVGLIRLSLQEFLNIRLAAPFHRWIDGIRNGLMRGGPMLPLAFQGHCRPSAGLL